MLEVLTIAAKHCETLTITTGIDHQFRTKKRREITEKVEVKNMGGFIGQLGGRVRYFGDEVDAKATARSYLAGIIQGMDACILGHTVGNYVALGEHLDYNNFIATTHDSYRIAGGNSDRLIECNRAAFRFIFGDVDVMGRLYDELKSQLGETIIPEPPIRGTLDVARILDANHILTHEPMEFPEPYPDDYLKSIGF